MKTKFILCATLLLLSLTVLAQESGVTYEEATPSAKPTEKHNVWWGPKVGLDLSPVSFNFDDIKSQFDNKSQYGIFFQFGKRLYLQPEIYYGTYRNSAYYYGYSGSYVGEKVNIIRVPVMLGLRILNLGLVTAHVMGGPAYDFILNDNVKFSDGKSNKFSWQVGAGVHVLGFVTADVTYKLKKGVSVSDQINNFDNNYDMLNLCVGLRFR